jgi:hypothetical protein
MKKSKIQSLEFLVTISIHNCECFTFEVHGPSNLKWSSEKGIVWALTKFITFYHLNYHLHINMCIHSKTLFQSPSLRSWSSSRQSKREGNLESNHQINLDHWDCFKFRVPLETKEMPEVQNYSSLFKQSRCIQMLALRNSLDHFIFTKDKVI